MLHSVDQSISRDQPRYRGGKTEHICQWKEDSYKLSSIPRDFPGGSDGKASVYNAGDLGSIPGSGRSTGEGNEDPGEGNGNPLQDYCLENPRDRGAW